MTGIDAIYISSNSFVVLGNLSDIFVSPIKIRADCGIDGLKFGNVLSSSWSDGTTMVILTEDSDNLTENLQFIWYEIQPFMDDGRPVVRADTRPLNTQTYFTDAGDDSTSIGGGIKLLWDFSNDEDLYTGPEVPSGFKCKQILLTFNCPIYLKDGAIYFFEAPFGAYIYMDIVVPAGNYYPNPVGSIPASALGLSGNKMYSYAETNVLYQRYVNKHHICGDCPMGDELNAEGASVQPVPVGWYVRGLIISPDFDTYSKGYASLEMYRCHSCLLPGQTIGDLH